MTKEEAYRLLDGVSGEIYDQVFYEYDPYEWTDEEYEALTMVIKTLKNLPSAQTEIIRCKDCKHLFEDNKCPLRTWWTHTEDDFCSYAERRTDE